MHAHRLLLQRLPLPHQPSALPAPLLQAYQDTAYGVWDTHGTVVLRAGQHQHRARQLLERNHARHAAVVTAWNPRSRRLPYWANVRAQQKLQCQVRKLGLRMLPAWGLGDHGDWPREPSLCLLDPPNGWLCQQMRDCGQNAWLQVERWRAPWVALLR